MEEFFKKMEKFLKVVEPDETREGKILRHACLIKWNSHSKFFFVLWNRTFLFFFDPLPFFFLFVRDVSPL